MTVSPVVVASRYRLGETLGRGGMGRVFLARDEILGRDVAIKEILLPEAIVQADRDAAQERTLREARAAARISHPNAAQVFDVVAADGRTWIVMEYVRSRSLQEVIADNGPLEPRRVAEIGLAVLDALDAAHRAGVHHRDVKPANVLLGDDGRVVLTDFGIASIEGDGIITSADMVLGSPQYMSPERVRDGTTLPASDLWSLGATLYTAVEGNSPYERASVMETLTAVAADEPTAPLRAGVLGPVLDGLLRKDPSTRIDLPEARRLLVEAINDQPAPGPRWSWNLRRGHRRNPTPPSPSTPAAPPAATASPAAVVPPAAAAIPVVPRQRKPETAPAAPAETPALEEAPAATEAAEAPTPAEAHAPEKAPAAAAPETPAAAVPPGDAPAVTDAPAVAPDARAEAPSGPLAPAGASALVVPRQRRPVAETDAGRGRPGAGAPPRRRRVLVAAAVAGVVLAGAGTTWLAGRDGEPATDSARKAPTASAVPSATPSAGPPSLAAVPPVSQKPAPSKTPAADSRPKLPAGWKDHRDPTGFRVYVPKGWKQSKRKTMLYFRDGKGHVLGIDQTKTPHPNPVADWTAKARYRNSIGDFPGYDEVKIEPVKYFQKAADWEYTFNGSNRRHVINRGVITSKRQAYGIYWETSDATWKADRAKLQLVFDSFRPKT